MNGKKLTEIRMGVLVSRDSAPCAPTGYVNIDVFRTSS